MQQQQDWVLGRVLDFLNFTWRAEDILAHPNVRKAAAADSGYVIGEKVAENIVTHRRRLPTRRYTSSKDILSVPGLGEDKLNDLLSSFSTPADEAFSQALFAGILGENWELLPRSAHYRKSEELLRLTAGTDLLKRTVADLCAADHPQRWLHYRQAHVDHYPESHLAAFQFAYWWYLFDQDNWFSYDRIKLACETYLSHHGYSQPGMELIFLRLTNQSPLNEVTRSELIPVVVNYPERVLTVWDAQLND